MKIELNVLFNDTPTADDPLNLTNTATASGTDPYGSTVEDDSSSDGEGDTPTPFTIPAVQAEFITTKTATVDPVNQDGTFDITFDVATVVSGDVQLSGVQLQDDLDAIFGTLGTINSITTTVTSING